METQSWWTRWDVAVVIHYGDQVLALGLTEIVKSIREKEKCLQTGVSPGIYQVIDLVIATEGLSC